MRLSLILLLLSLALAPGGSAVVSLSAGDMTVPVFIGERQFPVTARVHNGVSYLPVEAVARELKAVIEWDSRIGNLRYDGAPFSGKPLDLEGVLYISVSDLAHVLGGTIKYEENRAIRILVPGGAGISTGRGTTGGAAQGSGTGQGAGTSAGQGAGSVDQVFLPQSGGNDIYSVDITDVRTVMAIKDYYKPPKGFTYVVVNLSQQNRSDEVQIYSGKFKLLDDQGREYDYSELLSNFWLTVLRPGGLNFGYLVFELPEKAKSAKIVLETLVRPKLEIVLFPKEGT